MSDLIKIEVGAEIEAYGERFVCVMVEHRSRNYPRIEFISVAEADATSWVENSQIFAKNLRAYEEESAMALNITREARGYAEGQCNAISPRELGSLYCRRLPGHPASEAVMSPAFVGHGPKVHVNGSQGWQ